MKRKRLALAFVLSVVLSLLVAFFSNLAAADMAPKLTGRPSMVYGALIIAFVVSLPLTTYVFLRTLPPTGAPSQEEAHLRRISPILRVIQRMTKARNVTGVKAKKATSGSIEVFQEFDAGKDVAGAEIDEIGGGSGPMS